MSATSGQPKRRVGGLSRPFVTHRLPTTAPMAQCLAVRTLALLLCSGVGLTSDPDLATAQAASRDSAARVPHAALTPVSIERTRVLVSSREVRVIFPRDTAGPWGWSAREAVGYAAAYQWTVLIDGMDGPHLLSLRTSRMRPVAQSFASLESLVAAGKLTLCVGDMSGRCVTEGLSATVADGRTTLALRTPAVIDHLFRLRQPTVVVWHHRPEAPDRYTGDTIPVEYGAPQIPEPNADSREEARVSRRAFEASVSFIAREIGGGHPGYGPMWFVLGDSAVIGVGESGCRYDVCGGLSFSGTTAWTVDDSSIVRLHEQQPQRHEGPGGEVYYSSTSLNGLVVTARRLGRTTVRVRLGPSPSDTMPSSSPPARALGREVVVTLPIARVELLAPADTIRTGEQSMFKVRVFDREGHLLERAPVEARVVTKNFVATARTDGRLLLTFRSPGQHTIVATFGGKSDTLAVTAYAR